MSISVQILQAGLLVWFALLAMLIARRIFTGNINVAGMLTQHPEANNVAPERAVAMAISPFVIIGYAIAGLQTDVSGPHPSLPDVPYQIITLLIGSNGLYLVGKFARG